ncbi:MAG TPA: hypothetical protein VEB21_17285 [Terriglobales bacterium]|nr:hypothetical protein [Terriglobales bacterium]
MQELVRLHRLGSGRREVARLLGVSPNTERQYREILEKEGLLVGAADQLPELEELKAAVAKHWASNPAQVQPSSVERWAEQVTGLLAKGARPKAIYDYLRLEVEGFSGSHSAIKRLCRRLAKAKGIEAKDVVIPVISARRDRAGGLRLHRQAVRPRARRASQGMGLCDGAASQPSPVRPHRVRSAQ